MDLGALVKDKPVADIVSKDEFGDFELELEWKIGEAGNSGSSIAALRVRPHLTGPRLNINCSTTQGRRQQTRLTCAGAAYGLYPSPAGHLKPVGRWNLARIVGAASREHWLKRRKLLEYELGSPDWEAKVKASKFTEWPNYGRAKRGHIALQGDHEGSLAFRNIRIREIR